ncbi:MAG: PTS glucose transporter subunit IIA [Verrucomicrobia bacterium]|nr:PTS glucose transporter subunit IIA [Verrucomicrobiota bacterium]
MNDEELVLLAPVSGIIYPLERVPDPVFSQKLAGDGTSIDPIDNILRAPCAGQIVQRHGAGHAVTLKTAGEVEVLMHVGIDTVTLKGQGFTPRVNVGDKVETGAPLIEFDLDYIATHAKSLLTEVIISNGERVSQTIYGSGLPAHVGHLLTGLNADQYAAEMRGQLAAESFLSERSRPH